MKMKVFSLFSMLAAAGDTGTFREQSHRFRFTTK